MRWATFTRIMREIFNIKGDCECPPPFISQRNGTCGVCARPMPQRQPMEGSER